MKNTTLGDNEILSGPEYFYCKKHYCTMKKKVCLINQDCGSLGVEVSRYSCMPGRFLRAFDRRLSCKNCDQGKEIRGEMERDGEIQKSRS